MRKPKIGDIVIFNNKEDYTHNHLITKFPAVILAVKYGEEQKWLLHIMILTDDGYRIRYTNCDDSLREYWSWPEEEKKSHEDYCGKKKEEKQECEHHDWLRNLSYTYCSVCGHIKEKKQECEHKYTSICLTVSPGITKDVCQKCGYVRGEKPVDKANELIEKIFAKVLSDATTWDNNSSEFYIKYIANIIKLIMEYKEGK